MDKNVLLIVEGDADEVKFYNRLFSKFMKKVTYKFYSYRTNIHILAQELYNKYNDFDKGNIDIKLILASLETDKKKIKLLREKYSDVFLVFDFESQHDTTHFDTVKRMMTYFNDSTNQGKLFINYPMMQSYKNFSQLPCENFDSLKIVFEQVKEYKSIVGAVSTYTDLDKYDYILFYSIAVHHLKKANKIINGRYELPSVCTYLQYDYRTILGYQLNLLKNERLVSILNTCIFTLIDFAPTKFLNFVKNHKNDLLI